MTPLVPCGAGDVLAGKYRVARVIGEGGMGVVVEAHELGDRETQVALKFMLPSAMVDPDATRRFTHEARAAFRLKSEHVTKVLDVGTLDTGAPYIVMEYLAGKDLAQVLADAGGTLPTTELADYILQACEAIAEAHEQGIVHRDLKPANLFVTCRPDGTPFVKVLDFGISKASSLGDSAVSVTKSHAMLGSPLYMSPEQMKSSRDVDRRADVWSLGVILYELASGTMPFDAPTVGALMAKVLVERPVPLRALRADLPIELCDLVDACLANDPTKRVQDVGEIARVLALLVPEGTRHPFSERLATLARESPQRLRSTAHADTTPAPALMKSMGAVTQPDLTLPLASRDRRLRNALIAVGALAIAAATIVVATRESHAIPPTAPTNIRARVEPVSTQEAVPSPAPTESLATMAVAAEPRPAVTSKPVTASSAAAKPVVSAKPKASAAPASSSNRGVLDSWD